MGVASCGQCGAELPDGGGQGIGDVELCLGCWVPAVRELVKGARVAAKVPVGRPARSERRRRRLGGKRRRKG